jgi:hypothetical protein
MGETAPRLKTARRARQRSVLLLTLVVLRPQDSVTIPRLCFRSPLVSYFAVLHRVVLLSSNFCIYQHVLLPHRRTTVSSNQDFFQFDPQSLDTSALFFCESKVRSIQRLLVTDYLNIRSNPELTAAARTCVHTRQARAIVIRMGGENLPCKWQIHNTV